MPAGRQGVRHSQIPERSQQGRPVEEDIRVAWVRNVIHSSSIRLPIFSLRFPANARKSNRSLDIGLSIKL